MDNKKETYKDIHSSLTSGVEKINEEEEMNVSWKDVDWNEAKSNAAQIMIEKEKEISQNLDCEDYVKNASKYWEKFFISNENKFFKERNYFLREYAYLRPENCKEMIYGMECGCGTGCSVFPLIKSNKNIHYHAFDFSPKAVEMVKKNEEYNEERTYAFVADPSNEDFRNEDIKDNYLDFATMIFFLSAIAPDKMEAALKRIKQKMKPGSFVIVRDYGLYDMTQMRFVSKKGTRKLGENWYVRGDNTSSYFFSVEMIQQLFESCGFVTEECKYDTRELFNRKRKIKMYRVWIRGIFRIPN
eukprot:TRINITY_DN8058_c0_g1_i1.p1 TRINITY_DN8058_c0_g1~~TRINITY_DN8058_c0_g1_i1.p1  ORF type:complete len:300 (-),score=76.17 TRINITY_DN8058_c0_g1_i1:20-919(-)